MKTMLRRTVVMCGVGLALVPASSWAQQAVRVRGTIEKIDGHVLTVKSRASAETVQIVLSDPQKYVAMVKASMADIKPGMFVGTTAVPGEGDSLKAVEVHIFPEDMRGTGEGHRPWDLKPKSTMTNANVEQAVTGVDSKTMTLKYKGGEQKVAVTPETAVVTYAPGNAAEVKPGVAVIIFAQKQADGTLTAPRVTYGRDGLVPPM